VYSKNLHGGNTGTGAKKLPGETRKLPKRNCLTSTQNCIVIQLVQGEKEREKRKLKKQTTTKKKCCIESDTIWLPPKNCLYSRYLFLCTRYSKKKRIPLEEEWRPWTRDFRVTTPAHWTPRPRCLRLRKILHCLVIVTFHNNHKPVTHSFCNVIDFPFLVSHRRTIRYQRPPGRLSTQEISLLLENQTSEIRKFHPDEERNGLSKNLTTFHLV